MDTAPVLSDNFVAAERYDRATAMFATLTGKTMEVKKKAKDRI